MDYKELIDVLRNQEPRVVLEYIDDAATAIETLLAERDAAVEDLRGECRCCTHNTGWHNVGKCATCFHETRSMPLQGFKRVDNWEWSGPQKGGA